MALIDCKNALLETGLFGHGDEAIAMVDSVIDRLKNDRSLYYADGSLSPTKAGEAFKTTLAELKKRNRQTARDQLINKQAAAALQNTLDTWAKEAAAAGKSFTQARLLDIHLFGNNTDITLTGGKASTDIIGKTYAADYAQELWNAVKPLLDQHPGLGRLMGVSENIFKDAGTWFKNVGDKEFAKTQNDFYLDVQRVLEGGKVDDAKATAIGGVLSKMYRKIAFDINAAGGKINIRPNYNPHTHNAAALLNVTPEKWSDDIRGSLDWRETYPEAFKSWEAENEVVGIKRADEEFGKTPEAQELLDYVYDAVTNGKSIDFNNPDYKPSPRITRNFERGRTLEFRDPDSYAKYADVYGDANPIQTMFSKIRAAGATRAAFEKYGVNPEETINHAIKVAIEDINKDPSLNQKQRTKQINKIKGDVKDPSSPIGAKWHSMMGYSEMPVNNVSYDLGGNLRSFEQLKLGSSPFAAFFGDLLTASIQNRRSAGNEGSMFTLLTTVTSRFNFKDKEFTDQLGILSGDNIRGQHRYVSPNSVEETKGPINKASGFFMKMTGLSEITENARAGAQLDSMHNMAKNRNSGFEDLHPDVVHEIKQADISGAEWDLIRKNVSKSGDGVEYMLPKDTRKLSTDDIDTIIPEEFRPGNEPSLDFDKIETLTSNIGAETLRASQKAKFKIDQRLSHLDKKIVKTHSELAEIETKHNNEYARREENHIFDAIAAEDKAVSNILERAFKENQAKRSKARTISKTITKTQQIAVRQKARLKEHKATVGKFDEQRAALDKDAENYAKKLADVNDAEVRHHKRITDFEEKIPQYDVKVSKLDAERTELINSISDADALDIKNAKYEAGKNLESKLNALTDSTARAFDKEKKSLNSRLKELRLERRQRFNKYVEDAKAGAHLLDERNAKKLLKTLEKEQQRMDKWYLDQQKHRELTRRSLENKTKRMYVIMDSQAIVQQNARSKYITTGFGLKRGTFAGEVARTATQFKEQAITSYDLLINERRALSKAGGLESVTAGLGTLGTMAFTGYALMSIKDITSGREVRDPLDPKTWFDALAYSGGFGFMWDVLFNENRGYGNIGSLFGPVGGDLGEVAKAMYTLTNAMVPGSDTTMDDVGKEFAKTGFKVGLKNVVPRLWYTRGLVDYWLLNPLEEAINPGVFERRKNNMRKTTGQEYLAGQPYHKW